MIVVPAVLLKMDLFNSVHNRPMAAALTVTAIRTVVLMNLRGIKATGLFSMVTYSKLVPLRGLQSARAMSH